MNEKKKGWAKNAAMPTPALQYEAHRAKWQDNQSFKMVNNPSRVSTCWFVHSRRVQSIPLNIAMESSKRKNEATKSSSCSPSLNRLIEHDGHKL